MTDAADEPPVPKLPRGRGFKFSGPEIFRIAITLAMLVAVIALTKPCANAASTFVMGFEGSGTAKKGSASGSGGYGSGGYGSGGYGSGSTGSDVAKPSTNPEDYERLEPGMTDEQVRAAVARSKAKLGSNAAGSNAAGSNAAGSNAAGSNAAGSAAGSNAAGSNAAGSNAMQTGSNSTRALRTVAPHHFVDPAPATGSAAN